MADGVDNRVEGKSFEEVFFLHAQYSGLLPTKNHLTAFYLPGGRVKVVKSELDFRLIRREDGRVAYLDCKSFKDSFFVFSDLDEKQVERAILYNECNVPSGFVVYFRSVNRVAFFSGQDIAAKGPRARFDVSEGRFLGRIEKLDLKRIMEV